MANCSLLTGFGCILEHYSLKMIIKPYNIFSEYILRIILITNGAITYCTKTIEYFVWLALFPTCS